MQDEIIKSVQDAIRIKSVEAAPGLSAPFGEGVRQALEHALKLSEELGFKTVNVDNMLGYAEYGQGEEMVAVLGHLDIVPEGGGWTHPPYAAEIHDGKIYGRGATDDKGPTIGALYALRAIRDLGIPLKRRVRVMFGLNEETGSNCVKYYVDKGGEIPVCGFTPDAEYPIINGEKGIVTCKYRRVLRQRGDMRLASLTGGLAPNVVPDLAEAVVQMQPQIVRLFMELTDKSDGVELEEVKEGLKITARGVSAHGSTPEKGVNAIALLLLFLEKLNFSDDVGDFLQFFQNRIGMDLEGSKLGIYSEDDISGKFIFNLGTISCNGEELTLEINMRYPVTHRFEDFIGTFRRRMQDGRMEEVYLRHKKSLYVPADTPFIKKLQRVYEEKTGDRADLIAIGGGTYAKSLANIVAFGPIFRGQPMVEHQPDEYIKIDELIRNVQIMAAAICALAT